MKSFIAAPCLILWVIGLALIACYIKRAVKFLRKRKTKGKRDSDSEPDDATDYILLAYILNMDDCGSYNYYDDGL